MDLKCGCNKFCDVLPWKTDSLSVWVGCDDEVSCNEFLRTSLRVISLVLFVIRHVLLKWLRRHFDDISSLWVFAKSEKSLKGHQSEIPALWTQHCYFTKECLTVDVNTKTVNECKNLNSKFSIWHHNNETSQADFAWHNNLNALLPLMDSQMFNQLGASPFFTGRGTKLRLDLRCVVQVTQFFFFLSSGTDHNMNMWSDLKKKKN